MNLEHGNATRKRILSAASSTAMRPAANPIQIAAKLYDCRDTMKSLFGETYSEVTREYKEHLQAFADRNKVSVIDAALSIAKGLEANGHGRAIPLLLASAVELVEPSI